MCNKCVVMWTGVLSCAYAGILHYKATFQSDKDPITVRWLRTAVISVVAGMTGVAIGNQLPDGALSILPVALAAGSLIEVTAMSY